MTISEKQEKIRKYCCITDCDVCKLRERTWNVITGGHGCLDIYDSPEEDLDTALKLIDDSNNVDHPSHYQGKNECIDVMVAMFGVEAVKDFCKCNAYKYRFRSHMKNGEEDIKKAEWYESKLIELERLGEYHG